MSQEFIGVYATNETAPSLGEFPRAPVKRKRLWFAWETPEGKYKVQALNAVFQPMAEPRMVSAKEFEGRFTPEKNCSAVPEGYAAPAADGGSSPNAPAAPLPDLFVGAHEGFGVPNQAVSACGAAAADCVVRADDPDLLRLWAKGEGRAPRRTVDPAKIPFDQLVSEVAANPGGAAPGETSAFGDAGGHAAPLTESDAEQVRSLRSQFVQALLLLRRGARSESTALLQEMLDQPYAFFEGGGQLFSEFGLGLRRLGLLSLALRAHLRALEFVPRDERILFNIARSYHDLGQMPQAKAYLEQALAVSPDFALARQFLGFLGGEGPENPERRA